MEKLCAKCGERKPLDAFYRHKRLDDGRSPWCKACFKEYDRARNWGRTAAWRLRNLERYDAYLAAQRCATCGSAEKLHHHHRDPATKDPLCRGMRSMARSTSWERVEAELAKCDVLCAPCHRSAHRIERAIAG